MIIFFTKYLVCSQTICTFASSIDIKAFRQGNKDLFKG